MTTLNGIECDGYELSGTQMVCSLASDAATVGALSGDLTIEDEGSGVTIVLTGFALTNMTVLQGKVKAQFDRSITPTSAEQAINDLTQALNSVMVELAEVKAAQAVE